MALHQAQPYDSGPTGSSFPPPDSPRPHDRFLAELNLARADFPFGPGPFTDVDQAGKTSNDRIWAIGNVVYPAANVPMAIGAGAVASGAVNAALVEEDFDLAQAAAGH
ncbi:hypothetical protein ACVBEQ_00380 [Nakamurella sp. GG22]